MSNDVTMDAVLVITVNMETEREKTVLTGGF